MKKLTRKLFLSVVTLALAVVSLSTTTFAWFTSNAVAEQRTIGVRTQTLAGSSLFISNDGINFGPAATPVLRTLSGGNWSTTDPIDTLSPRQLTFASAPTYNAAQAAVSGTSPAYSANFSGVKPTFGTLTGGSTSGVLTYSLWFMNGGGSSTESIVIKTATFTTPVAPTAFNPSVNVDTTNNDLVIGTPYTAYLMNAARIAWTSYGNVSYTGSTLADDDLTTDARTYAHKMDNSSYGVLSNLDTVNNLALAYYNQMNGSGDDPVNEAGYTAVDATYVDQDATFDLANAGDTVVQSINASRIVRVDFYIWAEGWDSDCFEAILNQGITINMTFEFAAIPA